MVYGHRFGSRYSTVALKYVAQAIRTLRILFRERPRAIFVMTPPVAACLPVWLYSRLSHTPYVIDAHTGAFLDRRWKPLLFLHKWFSRAARATIVTNEYMKEIVEGWGAHATIVRDVPVCFADPAPVNLDGACNMTLVSTFTRDEPIETFLAAAARLPDISFHVTGNYRRAAPGLVERKSGNVRMTGFLPDAEYVGLLRASDAVISLTTLDNTMQRGAYEAVYLGRPVVTSNFDLLKRHFHKGAVHVENTVDGIVEGVQRMRASLANYRREVEELRAERLEEWRRVEADLRRLVA
jgi:hypothetical protein